MNIKMKRWGYTAVSLLVAVVFVWLLQAMMAQAQPIMNDPGNTTFRGNLTVRGALEARGPVQVGSGGSIEVRNSQGVMVAGLDSWGNVTATGQISTAAFSTANLVRGYADSRARLIGSLNPPTVTVTGTTTVFSGSSITLISSVCSLSAIPTTTVSHCYVHQTNNDILLTVRDGNNNEATVPAVVNWHAYVEGE